MCFQWIIYQPNPSTQPNPICWVTHNLDGSWLFDLPQPVGYGWTNSTWPKARLGRVGVGFAGGFCKSNMNMATIQSKISQLAVLLISKYASWFQNLLLFIEPIYCCLWFISIAKCNKAKSPGPTCISITDNKLNWLSTSVYYSQSQLTASKTSPYSPNAWRKVSSVVLSDRFLYEIGKRPLYVNYLTGLTQQRFWLTWWVW